MKWILLLGLWSCASFAIPPMVFMRENANGKQIMLKEEHREMALTEGAEWHLYPDISADGKWVTWVEGTDNRNLSVVLYNRETRSREKFLTPVKGMALQPRFTKNAQKIFFSAPTRNGNKIAVINPENLRLSASMVMEGETRTYKFEPETIAHDGQGFFPRPSSDGSFVIFQRNGVFAKEIVEYDFATNKTRVLANGMAPAMALDENLVAYTSKEAGSWDIWLIDRRSNNRSQHTNDSKDEMAPTFMTDNTVSFASNRQERFQIYHANEGVWRQLVDSNSDDYAPNFAGQSDLRQSFLAPMMGPLRSSFGAIEVGGKVYVCGGHAGAEHTYPPESFVDNLQVYDPSTNKWQELAPRPHKAHGYQLAAYGNYIYAFGGFAYEAANKPKWKSLDVIDRYDISTNEWTTVGKLPRARSSNVVAVIDSKAFLIGGWDSTPTKPGDVEGTFHAEVDVFDMAKEVAYEANWKMPSPLRRAFTSVVKDGRIILIGGLGVGSSHFELLASVTQLNPYTGFAFEMTTLPFATFAPAAGILGNELFVFGGMYKTSPQDFEYVAHVYSHNMDSNDWRHTGRFLRETKGFSQVVEVNNGVMVLGGHHYYGDRDEPVDTVEFFTK